MIIFVICNSDVAESAPLRGSTTHHQNLSLQGPGPSSSSLSKQYRPNINQYRRQAMEEQPEETDEPTATFFPSEMPSSEITDSPTAPPSTTSPTEFPSTAPTTQSPTTTPMPSIPTTSSPSMNSTTISPTQAPVSDPPTSEQPTTSMPTSTPLPANQRQLLTFSLKVEGEVDDEMSLRKDLELYLYDSMKDEFPGLDSIELKSAPPLGRRRQQRTLSRSLQEATLLNYDGIASFENGLYLITTEEVQMAQTEALEDVEALQAFLDNTSTESYTVISVQVDDREEVQAPEDAEYPDNDDDNDDDREGGVNILSIVVPVCVVFVVCVVVLFGWRHYRKKQPPPPPPYGMEIIEDVESDKMSSEDHNNKRSIAKNRTFDTDTAESPEAVASGAGQRVSSLYSDPIQEIGSTSRRILVSVQQQENAEHESLEVVEVSKNGSMAVIDLTKPAKNSKGIEANEMEREMETANTTLPRSSSTYSAKSSGSASHISKHSNGNQSYDTSTPDSNILATLSKQASQSAKESKNIKKSSAAGNKIKADDDTSYLSMRSVPSVDESMAGYSLANEYRDKRFKSPDANEEDSMAGFSLAEEQEEKSLAGATAAVQQNNSETKQAETTAAATTPSRNNNKKDSSFEQSTMDGSTDNTNNQGSSMDQSVMDQSTDDQSSASSEMHYKPQSKYFQKPRSARRKEASDGFISSDSESCFTSDDGLGARNHRSRKTPPSSSRKATEMKHEHLFTDDEADDTGTEVDLDSSYKEDDSSVQSESSFDASASDTGGFNTSGPVLTHGALGYFDGDEDDEGPEDYDIPPIATPKRKTSRATIPPPERKTPRASLPPPADDNYSDAPSDERNNGKEQDLSGFGNPTAARIQRDLDRLMTPDRSTYSPNSVGRPRTPPNLGSSNSSFDGSEPEVVQHFLEERRRMKRAARKQRANRKQPPLTMEV